MQSANKIYLPLAIPVRWKQQRGKQKQFFSNRTYRNTVRRVDEMTGIASSSKKTGQISVTRAEASDYQRMTLSYDVGLSADDFVIWCRTISAWLCHMMSDYQRMTLSDDKYIQSYHEDYQNGLLEFPLPSVNQVVLLMRKVLVLYLCSWKLWQRDLLGQRRFNSSPILPSCSRKNLYLLQRAVVDVGIKNRLVWRMTIRADCQSYRHHLGRRWNFKQISTDQAIRVIALLFL
jgi:hypothetical protein